MVTIDVKPLTWEKLNSLKTRPSDSFDFIINKLLDVFEVYDGSK